MQMATLSVKSRGCYWNGERVCDAAHGLWKRGEGTPSLPCRVSASPPAALSQDHHLSHLLAGDGLRQPAFCSHPLPVEKEALFPGPAGNQH